MQTPNQTFYAHPFSGAYWRDAARQLSDVRMLCLAALFIALRVAIRQLMIPVGPNLNITASFLVNSLGALLYGPVVAFFAACASDTIGALLFPQGVYFFPFIFVEISSSVLFALFLWRARLSTTRIFLSRFSVTLVSNLLLTPAIMVWYYKWLGEGKNYAFVTIPRVVKNLALLPAEIVVLVLFFSALTPLLVRLGFLSPDQTKPILTKRHWLLLGVLFVVAVAVIILYYRFYLKKM